MIHDKRNKNEMELDILKTIYYGTYIPTNISRNANLPYQKFKKIINNLKNNDLVKKVKGYYKDKRIKYIFEITGKGENYLFDELLKTDADNKKCSRHRAARLIQNIYCLNCGKRYVE